MTEPSCGTCHFWQREREDDDVGRCRRFPPANTKMPGQLEQFAGGAFPVTYERRDWCGEWKPNYATLVAETEARSLNVTDRRDE